MTGASELSAADSPGMLFALSLTCRLATVGTQSEYELERMIVPDAGNQFRESF